MSSVKLSLLCTILSTAAGPDQSRRGGQCGRCRLAQHHLSVAQRQRPDFHPLPPPGVAHANNSIGGKRNPFLKVGLFGCSSNLPPVPPFLPQHYAAGLLPESRFHTCPTAVSRHTNNTDIFAAVPCDYLSRSLIFAWHWVGCRKHQVVIV